MRHGWTLHEMLISMCVLSGVLALAAHMATEQLRFFRGVGDVAGLRGQVGQASAIVASVLWSVSPGAGDIAVAQDSALEIRMVTGTAVVCGSEPGRLTIPAPVAARGNALSAFVETPEAGDRVWTLFDDSLGTSWLALTASASATTGGSCPFFPQVAATWTLPLQEPVTAPVGAPLRFTRPFRLSLYRGSDGRWYLGARDWNGESGQFNTIQPVAGPLSGYSENRSSTGLLFVYRDAAGAVLSSPVETSRIASVTVISRAASGRPVRMRGMGSASSAVLVDSTVVTVALRNSR